MPTSRTDREAAADHATAPVDVETISEITGQVLDLRLTTSTREDILAHAAAVHGFLNLLVREELGADQDPFVRDVIGKAYVLLAAKAPTRETPCFSAYAHVREAADITRRLLRVWVGRHREAERHDRDGGRLTGECP
ncbi:hypothetical protein [Streptomyces sp. NPDC001770]